MLNSFFRPLCPIQFPAFAGRQHYMHGFDLAAPTVPEGFEGYLKPVQQLIAAAGAHIGKAFLTIDEKILNPGDTQRKPGPHVDGAYLEHKGYWGGGGGGWNHSCNAVPFARMPVIVASTVPLCKAWDGIFDATPSYHDPVVFDGDLSHVQHVLDDAPNQVLPSHYGFILSPDCVHESLPALEACERSFLRIALPTDFKIN
jgi:hypothetical protein